MSSFARVSRLGLVPVAFVPLLAACGAAVTTPSPAATDLAASSPPSAAATALGPTPVPTFARNPAPYVEGEPYAQTIVPAMFVGGIDNPFFPMTRGASFAFDGAEHAEVNVEVGGKEILGVYTPIVRDQVFEDGELVEDTRDWYAQDSQGNVWYFGEETAEYENGQVSSTAGSWEAGVDGALPGIVMLARPEAGDQYRQEFLAGEAEDLAEVIATSGQVQSKAGRWSGSDVLVTEEWTPLEPGVRERKTYARGVGVVEIRTIQGGDEVTTLTSSSLLTTGTRLGPAGSASAAGGALFLLAAAAAARPRRPGVRSRLSGGTQAEG